MADAAKAERYLQEAAFKEVKTIDWWFRRHYNLAPTDPRYLNVTREQMWIEYWTIEFEERWAKAVKLHIKVEKMQDLLDVDEKNIPGTPMSDEEFDRRLNEMELEDQAEEARRAAGLPPKQEEEPHGATPASEEQPETVIRFRSNGRRS